MSKTPPISGLGRALELSSEEAKKVPLPNQFFCGLAGKLEAASGERMRRIRRALATKERVAGNSGVRPLLKGPQPVKVQTTYDRTGTDGRLGKIPPIALFIELDSCY
eukprot:4955711-Amphidinium_carterae.1